MFSALHATEGMGLQYFEALPTANISSILAVLFNRVVTGNGLQGYYYYPFAVAPLKSHVFYIAIAYGLIGALVGTIYCKSVKNLKNWVQGWGGCRGPTLNYTQVEGNTLHGEESWECFCLTPFSGVRHSFKPLLMEVAHNYRFLEEYKIALSRSYHGVTV